MVAMATFCEKMEKSTHLHIDFLSYGEIPALDPAVELSIYRMVQELVQNILKHASATQALVQLSCENNLLNVTVEDNGRGISEHDDKHTTGTGLTGIQARVQALNGHMDLKSIKNKGTAVYLEFDLHNMTIINELCQSAQIKTT